MVERRQVLRGLLLGAVGLAGPVACGVPSGGKPTVDGVGPTTGTSGFAGSSGEVPHPDHSMEPKDLVLAYLTAAIGAADDSGRQAAENQAEAFMTANARADWAPADTQITVVRVDHDRISLGLNGSTWEVDVPVRQVGHLTSTGAVAPAPSAAVTARFHVISNPDNQGGYLIDSLPSMPSTGMLLDSLALDYLSGLYTPQLVYYWTSDNEGLVSDLRYIPVVGPSALKQSTEIVNRLLDGPPDWLAPAVQPLGNKPKTTLIGPNVVLNGTEPVINLSYLPDKPNADAIINQLRWSLSPQYSGPVQVQMAGAKLTGTGQGYAAANLADQQLRGGTSPDEFCVLDKVARPLSGDDMTPLVLQSAAYNKGVVAAALNRDKTRAALVREAPGGRYELWLGRAGEDPGSTRYQRIDLLAATISRPVWLPSTPARVLVVADGRLYTVLADGQTADLFMPSAMSRVDAFSVAPDGRRLAVIGDAGTPAVVSLVHSGNAVSLNGTLATFPADVLQAGTLTAVAWSRLDRVVLAGRDPGSNHNGLAEVSIDGAVATLIPGSNIFSAPITSVVSYPLLPTGAGSERGKTRIQVGSGAGAVAYDVFPSRPSPLVYRPATSASPAPSASAGSTPKRYNPVAPFFLD